MNYDVSDIQPGILKSHGRRYTNYILLDCGVVEDNYSDFKRWINSIFENKLYIINFQDQLSNSFQRKYDKGNYEEKAVITIAFGRSFFDQLQGCVNKICMFPPEDELFIKGMYDRRSFFHDYESWKFDYSDDNTDKKVNPFFLDFDLDEFGAKRPKVRNLEIFISVSHHFKGRLKKITQNILEGAQDFTFDSFCKESAIVKNKKKQSLSPLGFVDGVSERKDLEIVIENTLVSEKWVDSIRSQHFGSYLAFRIIEVNKKKFESRISEMVTSCEGELKEDFARAMIIGRHPQGAPLVKFSFSETEDSEWTDGYQDIPFNFDEDVEGNKCPMNSHIRRMRSGGRAKIVRRGTTYPSTMKENEVQGLCFLSYQSELKNFENLFKRIGRVNRVDPVDMLLYSPSGDRPDLKNIKLPVKWGESKQFETKVMGQEVTIFRGGGYFYAPSVSFIRSLIE